MGCPVGHAIKTLERYVAQNGVDDQVQAAMLQLAAMLRGVGSSDVKTDGERDWNNCVHRRRTNTSPSHQKNAGRLPSLPSPVTHEY